MVNRGGVQRIFWLPSVVPAARLSFSFAGEEWQMTQEWRQHPKLRQRFHPEAVNDLQVIVHDGGPRLSRNLPELVWVTVTSYDGVELFSGRVLNQPQQLKSVSQGSVIKFIAPAGNHLVMVTEKYLAEREKWTIHGCSKCGLNELFDAPSDLIRVIFPDLSADDSVKVFTSFCGICGGMQVIQDRHAQMNKVELLPGRQSRKWWQFWR